MGGEKGANHHNERQGTGSPPRGRGKAQKDESDTRPHRITPAWAGKSYLPQNTEIKVGDHPRVGGEKALTVAIFATSRRITPAWAGKSIATAGLGAWDVDHPRVGGEKADALRVMEAWGGSPPRGRGKELNHHQQAVDVGITPAWAGKSIDHRDRHQQGQDHPRVGGEKTPGETKVPTLAGSPPRGRGKGTLPSALALAHGITPAWAGKRLRRCCTALRRWDHPRVGGEKVVVVVVGYVEKGSPPRGRGKD